MILRLPSYYKEFSCIADRCQHSCCLGWEIDIDEETWDYYQRMEGPFGDRLRANMAAGSDNSFMLQEGSRCPFLNEKNLCDIVIELGETSLCAICTEYPRQTLEYADVRERCLSISCEEVGRILFEKTEPVRIDTMEDIEIPVEDAEEIPEVVWEEELTEEDFEEETEEEEACEFEYVYDESGEDVCPERERGAYLTSMRDYAIALLQDRTEPMEERIVRYLAFCSKVQDYMNEERWEEMEELTRQTCESWKLSGEEGFNPRTQTLRGLEILDEEWEGAFAEMQAVYGDMDLKQRISMIGSFMEYYREREYEYENLMVYFTFRYLLKSVFDYQFLGKAQLAVLSFLVIRDMDAVHFHTHGSFTLQDRIDLARIYSREVEHSEDNLEYLADEFMFTEELNAEHLAAQVLLGLRSE